MKIVAYNPKIVFDKANDRFTTSVDNKFDRWKN